jgi:hypothetical protein
MTLAGHVAHMRRREMDIGIFWVFGGGPEGWRPLGRPSRR